MADIVEIKKFFKKLQSVINNEAVFVFFNTRLVKKSRVDDLYCCILSLLPDKYKKLINFKEGRRPNSVICFNALKTFTTKKFFLDSNLYVVNTKKANNMIAAILSSIEQDINFVEKN